MRYVSSACLYLWLHVMLLGAVQSGCVGSDLWLFVVCGDVRRGATWAHASAPAAVITLLLLPYTTFQANNMLLAVNARMQR